MSGGGAIPGTAITSMPDYTRKSKSLWRADFKASTLSSGYAPFAVKKACFTSSGISNDNPGGSGILGPNSVEVEAAY